MATDMATQANMAFLFLQITLALAVMLMWAFWSLEQWRERQTIFRRLDPFKVHKRK